MTDEPFLSTREALLETRATVLEIRSMMVTKQEFGDLEKRTRALENVKWRLQGVWMAIAILGTAVGAAGGLAIGIFTIIG